MSIEAYIQLPPDSTGKKLRVFEREEGPNTVHQEVHADTYNGGEILADQEGANGVLTFTFSEAVHLVWVRSDGADARADPFGGTPSISLGIVCEDGLPTPLTVAVTVVRVWAPVGATVRVHGYRY